MNNDLTLAEMANNTNYAAMDYYQLVALNLAFTWAGGIIKTLLPIKKKEAMEALTNNYIARTSKGVGALVLDAVASEAMVDDGEIHSAIPESTPSVMKGADEDPSLSDNKPMGAQNTEPIVPKQKKNTSVTKKAIDARVMQMIQDIPLGDNIDPSAPYYFCYEFKNPKGGDLIHTRSAGWNASPEVVKMLQITEKMYMEERRKAWTKVIDDYNIYHIPGGWIRVSYFKSTGEYKRVVPDSSEHPKDVQDTMEFCKEIEQIFGEAYGKSPVVPNMKGGTLVENAETKPSIKSQKKVPRSIAIVGTKDGETKRWSSFRECEREVGAGYGSVSQFFSGKMKSVKGWIITKEGEEADRTPETKGKAISANG